MNWQTLTRMLWVAITLPLPAAVGERVDLYVGGGVTGQTKVVSDDKDRQQVWVKTDPDLVLVLPKSRVRSIEPADKLAAYERFAGQTGQDAERHYKLSVWCKTNHLPEQSRYHLQRAITLNPDHVAARASLGYKQINGRWTLFTDLQRSRGLVHVGGNLWKAPEQISREEVRKETDKTAKLWKRKLSQMLAALSREEPDAWANLEAIDDPLAADAIAEQLEKSRGGRQPRRLRSLWVRLLGKLDHPSARKALVRAGLEEPDRRLQQDILEQLQTNGRSSAVASYTDVLVKAAAGKHPDAKGVSLAATALQSFVDPEMALVWVDALVTEHIRAAPQQPGMTFGFGDTGANGMQAGSAAKAEIRRSQNGEVRNLLRMIEPEADYGFDENAWRRHFALQRSRYQGDLRRDGDAVR
ncbi:hypothetical protein [Crateriforma conspicua]|uniref:hypothetical protein n=1 Tax=Crateriforma conspicua TaxID=2527996 RepID=UPI00118A8048|nr:hypothetical protein [Crateriforma conspicua]QDV64996.1 hypothetical protein Mal65_41650 [Crateriforma conspicua]